MRIFSAIAVVFLLAGCASSGSQEDQVCFKERCFEVEVVQDQELRTRGLMFRESMAQDHGMLFVFPSVAVYPFWMKNTLMPLDMIWMDSARRIVHVETDVPPCEKDPCPVVTPQGQALYVLEVNAGQAEKLGLKVGQFAEFRLINR